MSNLIVNPILQSDAPRASAAQHYLDYVCEREHLTLVDYGVGFALYRIIKPDNLLYMHTVYVTPLGRGDGIGPYIASNLEMLAKELGLKGICTSVSPNGAGSNLSLNAILKLGYKLHSSEKDLVWLYKGF